MTRQSEQQLEKTLIDQFNRLGFESVVIEDPKTLERNLKAQLEKFKGITFSDSKFTKILAGSSL